MQTKNKFLSFYLKTRAIFYPSSSSISCIMLLFGTKNDRKAIASNGQDVTSSPILVGPSNFTPRQRGWGLRSPRYLLLSFSCVRESQGSCTLRFAVGGSIYAAQAMGKRVAGIPARATPSTRHDGGDRVEPAVISTHNPALFLGPKFPISNNEPYGRGRFHLHGFPTMLS